jgi:type VI secretion system secreted protein VgrG
VSKGNIKIKAGKGKIQMEAKQKIELKVGQSVIKITPKSIEMKSTMVKIDGKMLKFEGKAMTMVKGKITKVEGNAMLVAKGGITMIN